MLIQRTMFRYSEFSYFIYLALHQKVHDPSIFLRTRDFVMLLWILCQRPKCRWSIPISGFVSIISTRTLLNNHCSNDGWISILIANIGYWNKPTLNYNNKNVSLFIYSFLQTSIFHFKNKRFALFIRNESCFLIRVNGLYHIVTWYII